MSSTRLVPMTDEQVELIEAVGLDLLRASDSRASVLLGIVLAWRVQPVQAFRCDVDESTGMAEVVELHGYSKKAPCA